MPDYQAKTNFREGFMPQLRKSYVIKKGEEKLPTIGPTELIIVLVIVLIIFGVGRLPQVGRGIGQGIREFRESIKFLKEDERPPPTCQDKT